MKCYAFLTIVLVLLILRGDALGDDLAFRTPSSATGAEMTVYPHSGLIPIPGIVRPSKQVTMASPMEGMLMTLCVREGQQVEANDVLATIDNRVTQAAVNLAQAAADRSANLQHAHEELKFADSLLERLLKLQSANGGSDFELLEARSAAHRDGACSSAGRRNHYGWRCETACG